MQKKIIALAIAAAFSAPAFADTTAYGVADVAVAHLSADGKKSDTQVVSGGLSTSRLGVMNVEDLGNGMKTLAVIEYKIDFATNQQTQGAATSNLSARQQLLGLTGDFGTVAAGFLQTAAYDWAVKYNPVEGSAISPLNNVIKANGFLISGTSGANRAQHALAYLSNDMSGFKFAVNYTTGFDGNTDLALANTAPIQNKTSAYLLSANYSGVQNLEVGITYISATAGTGFVPGETSTLSPKEYALGASYDFGVAKLFATYQSYKSGTNNLVVTEVANKAESISAVIPAGPGAVVLSYAKATVSPAQNAGSSGETIAYTYNLSKMDTIYAAYSKMSQDNATNANSVDLNAQAAGSTLGAGSSIIAVGLRKKF